MARPSRTAVASRRSMRRVDRLPDRRHLRLGRVADADAVDGHVVVVGERDGVAVEVKRLPSQSDSASPSRLRAQQDLGRAERAGAEHDDVGVSEILCRAVRRRQSAGCSPHAPAVPSRPWRSDSTRMPVKISAPNAAASAR